MEFHRKLNIDHYADLISFFCRDEKIASEIYDQSLQLIAINHSDIYNAMIYPFTRMVIYGAIWYQGLRV